MRDAVLTALAYGAVLAFTLGLIPATFAIDKWERQNGYPYGKMCNSIFTLNKDTCHGR